MKIFTLQFRCMPLFWIMTFTAAVATAQTYSPLYAPNTSVLVYAGCTNPSTGLLIANCNVTLSTSYYADTNAHTASQHTGSAPLSTVSPSSGNTGPSGLLPITLTTTAVGHAEYVHVCAVGGTCSNTDYAVGYTIYFVTDHGIWTLVGATARHGNSTAYNHWMTTNAAYGIYYATLAYVADGHPGLVSVNDMSLPFGGRFDISGNWSTPHLAHTNGRDVDINGTLGSFTDFCTANGADYILVHGPGNLHCRWPN